MTIHELRISLDEVEPVVWRRLHVPSVLTLAQLHLVIQTVMPWQDCHLHEFMVRSVRYGIDDGESFDEPPKDEHRANVVDLTTTGMTFTYTYDFGDGWQHSIEVLGVHPSDPAGTYPVCLDGARACPPEDVGGPTGYEEFRNAIADPGHEEHKSYVRWVGGSFDPEHFDVPATNARLGRLSLSSARHLER